MTVVYVKEQGSIIRKRGSRLVVQKDGETLTEILTRHTESVSVFGNVQVTTQAMSEMLDKGIGLSLYNAARTIKGPHCGGGIEKRGDPHPAVPRRIRRNKMPGDSAKGRKTETAEFAALLEDYRSNYAVQAFSDGARRLKTMAEECLAVASRNELLGKEGAGAAAYFQALSLANRSEIPFEGRRMHPATDPMNALLSLGYTFAMNEIRGAVEAAGMDPYVGFLHVPDYGRPSLALDLLEAFRAPLIDRLTLRLLNERILTAEDFGKRVSGTHAGSVVLVPEALRRYLERWEEAVREPRKSAPVGFREIFGAEVGKLREWLRTSLPFEPYAET